MVWVFQQSDFQTIYRVTDFCNILQHIVKSKIIQTFKKLLKFESVSRSDLKNSVYLWLNLPILFSCVFKKQTWLQIEIHIYVYCFPLLIFYSSFEHKIVYNDIKLCHQIEVFTPEYSNANNKLHEAFLNPQYTVLTISKVRQINNKSFYRLLIVLSGDIGLNPWPACKHQILNTTEWDVSKQKVCI